MTGQAAAAPPSSPFDAAFVADPYPTYAALREAGPVHQVTLPDGSAVWLVTRYADVRAALADQRLSLDKANSDGSWRGFSLPPALDANLLNMDPPNHTRIRRLIAQAFGPQRIAGLRPRVEAAAQELLDRVAAHGHADLVADFAGPLPVTVISDLLGVPEADRAALRGWTDVMLSPPADDPRAGARVIMRLQEFLVALIADKRRQPGDDLLSAMIAARDTEADGGTDRLSEDELTSLAFLVLFAGYENSVHLIGTGLLALLRHPEQLDAVRAAPELPAGAVEELLRYEPPAPVAFRRFPLTDVTIGGVHIPAGAAILVNVAAANRDPLRFDQPELLDVNRSDSGHLTLGHGIHYCVGAPLARLELQVAIGAVIRRFPKLTLAVDPADLSWRPSFRTRGLRSLPVTF
ncbi:cytochrome P450 [Micromonospora pisi]|uniref:Cytochrome P450 n=1 Tax=Micromonospora pisi TaxID=589240 RepID=A0A495JD55_9ACTN|nr:cytochrome P450 [Micromonospora pisi]RKR86950.1 cytochrome P450 [Micromonospora pisi]